MIHASLIRSSLRHARLGLTAIALLGAAGCDADDSFDEETMADLAQDADAPGLAEAAVQDLVADTAAVAATSVHEYIGSHSASSIGDGDVVMIKNWWRGYLGCNDDGTSVGSHNPAELDPYVWIVHEADIDGDGTIEHQFEQVDDAGGTGQYLKMNGSGEVFCGSITGVGDAAGWNIGSAYSSVGNYKRVARVMSNYKQGLCLQIDGNDEGASATCNGYMHKLFTFETIDTL